MKEYYGESAKLYKPRKINLYILMPAIDRAIPKSNKLQQKLLDIGCGNGDYFSIADKKGYKYYGFDASPDMIRIARDNYPKGKFLIASSMNFSHYYKNKFDIVLINMLLPTLKNKDKIINTLKEAKTVLTKNGKIIIGIGHPCFNHYMQKYIFKRNDVKTDFHGYFKSEIMFKVPQKFDNKQFIFKDYHRSITDYFDCIHASGLAVTKIDECEPVNAKNKKDNIYLKKFKQFPIYLIFICK